MIKRIFLFLLTLTLLINVQAFASDTVVTGKQTIERFAEFIDLDQNTVKFLFKTNIGSQVQFFLGEKKGKMALVKTVDNYDYQKGMVIERLIPGKTYYYRIVSQQGSSKKVVSPINSFVKLNRVNTNIRAEWAKTAIFYEIFIRSFADGDGDGIGDLKGLKGKIGYLKELGATAIWLMPCFDSPSYHANDCSDYYKIKPDYGTNADFQEFLNTAHAQGLKVIIDLAINHTSREHAWFLQAQKSRSNRYHNYYVWADMFDDITVKGSWAQQIWHDVKGSSYLGTFSKRLPDLNLRYYPVREEIKKIVHHWLDPNQDGDPSDGVDGFRVDAVMHIDPDPEITHKWWQEFNAYVKAINPNAFLVGEVYAGDEKVASYLQDMDSCFNFRLANRIVYMSGGRYSDPIAGIRKTHLIYSEYATNYIDSIFISNQDQTRIGTIVEGDAQRKKLCAALLLTLPGTPFIFYGEELGQEANKPDEAVRGAFDWYAAASGAGMTKGQLESLPYTKPNDGISVEEEINDSHSVLNYYQKLIRIRKENPSFFTGDYHVVTTPKDTYGYFVEGNSSRLLVIHNLSTNEQRVSVESNGMELLSNKAIADMVTMGPYETVIIKYSDAGKQNG